MTAQNLKRNILTRKANVAVVGLGYVGLPLSIACANAGFRVFGIGKDKGKIEKLKKGESYIGDVSSEEVKKAIAKKRFIPSLDASSLKKADIILICVPTPLDKYKIPDASYIEEATKTIASHLKRGQLVILESTTYPCCTEELVKPLLEQSGLKAGNNFWLAFSPERVDPGNTSYPLSKIPKIVGGIDKHSTDLAALFYEQFTPKPFKVSSPRAAEMAKLLENIFRLVNISLVNELSLLCGKMGVDIWEVIEAAKTKPYGFMPFYPSPKIGGHCIPLDPFYLSWKAKEYNFWPRFIELAGEINEQMPHYVVTKVISALNGVKKSVKGSKILIWGVTYKKDIADERESGAFEIMWDLERKGAKLDYFDPFVKTFTVNKKLRKSISYKPRMLKSYDLVLILADHSGFDYEELARNAGLVVDTRNAIKARHSHVIR